MRKDFPTFLAAAFQRSSRESKYFPFKRLLFEKSCQKICVIQHHISCRLCHAANGSFCYGATSLLGEKTKKFFTCRQQMKCFFSSLFYLILVAPFVRLESTFFLLPLGWGMIGSCVTYSAEMSGNSGGLAWIVWLWVINLMN
jgi:hypothetical protein